MIVIVIVGILSAIALPNFLSQSDKAKLTDAKQQSAAYLKQAFAEYQEQGAGAINTAKVANGGICPANGTYFEYACTALTDTSTEAEIVATGLPASGGLNGSTLTSTVNFSTGVIDIPASATSQ